jgi:hypothetical protein
VGNQIELTMKPVKRATDIRAGYDAIFLSSAARTSEFCFVGYPALKGWAISGRPLRGLIQIFLRSNYYFQSVDASGLPHELQKRPFGSFCTAPQDAHDAVRMLAPHEEQNAEPAVFAEPQVPQRPGIGGTYPPALRVMCASIIFQASSVSLYCQ